MTRTGTELFQSQTTRSCMAGADEGCISPELEIVFPNEPCKYYFFVTPSPRTLYIDITVIHNVIMNRSCHSRYKQIY